MTKQTKKPTTRKTTKKATPLSSPFPERSDFQRWLLPGLLSIASYLFASLVGAVFIERDGGVTRDENTLISLFLVAALVFAAWWLVESARVIVHYIERRAIAKTKKK